MVLVLLVAFAALATCSVFQPQGRSVKVAMKDLISDSPTTVDASPFDYNADDDADYNNDDDDDQHHVDPYDDTDDEVAGIFNGLHVVAPSRADFPRPSAPAPLPLHLRTASPPTPAVKRHADHDESPRALKKRS